MHRKDLRFRHTDDTEYASWHSWQNDCLTRLTFEEESWTIEITTEVNNKRLGFRSWARVNNFARINS
ncbi:unnamed protein product [Allacma fusca]|uniref:Uncharacterized protein n=1 Tax=Allacma fusca TaxID=39272 RepID=A0A8J2JC80_9HEXA|nr:unnamed protein product [Allacma fusca]